MTKRLSLNRAGKPRRFKRPIDGVWQWCNFDIGNNKFVPIKPKRKKQKQKGRALQAQRAAHAEKKLAESIKMAGLWFGRVKHWQKRAEYYRGMLGSAPKRSKQSANGHSNGQLSRAFYPEEAE